MYITQALLIFVFAYILISEKCLTTFPVCLVNFSISPVLLLFFFVLYNFSLYYWVYRSYNYNILMNWMFCHFVVILRSNKAIYLTI